jgi:hypothetical protein
MAKLLIWIKCGILPKNSFCAKLVDIVETLPLDWYSFFYSHNCQYSPSFWYLLK